MKDLTVTKKLGLSFSIRRGRLLIYYATIRALGNPDYIRFLFNSRDKKIAIQCCDPIDRDSFRVNKYQEGMKYQFEITSSPFLSVIYKTCHWDADQTYLCYGKEYPENRLVEYKLEDATVIAADQFVDPGVTIP